ncbi:hypothetical protein [Pollutimonas harenae]|uniref:Uncharacterized protein n=1 Tax=Pollutimonas harenae TaxID=657015 RepID=A0A853GR52_9BURK|nr:hypothetical protein [Pollutimonas harenae]NYT84637.1 hypothetical protein [Pollutimonas harenae]
MKIATFWWGRVRHKDAMRALISTCPRSSSRYPSNPITLGIRIKTGSSIQKGISK